MKAREKEVINFFSSASMPCYPFGKAKRFHWFSFRLHSADSAPRFLLLFFFFPGERKSNIETSVINNTRKTILSKIHNHLLKHLDCVSAICSTEM